MNAWMFLAAWAVLAGGVFLTALTGRLGLHLMGKLERFNAGFAFWMAWWMALVVPMFVLTLIAAGLVFAAGLK